MNIAARGSLALAECLQKKARLLFVHPNIIYRFSQFYKQGASNHEQPNQQPDTTDQEVDTAEREHLLAHYTNETAGLWPNRNRLLGNLLGFRSVNLGRLPLSAHYRWINSHLMLTGTAIAGSEHSINY